MISALKLFVLHLNRRTRCGCLHQKCLQLPLYGRVHLHSSSIAGVWRQGTPQRGRHVVTAHAKDAGFVSRVAVWFIPAAVDISWCTGAWVTDAWVRRCEHCPSCCWDIVCKNREKWTITENRNLMMEGWGQIPVLFLSYNCSWLSI